MSTVELTAAPVQPTTEQVVESIYRYAIEQMQKGVSAAKIKMNLVEQGLDAYTADSVVANLKKAKSQALRQAGPRNMLVGALWCVGGIAVTAGTYALAEGGGTFVVAWGAVLFGAIQFLRGLFQTIRGMF